MKKAQLLVKFIISFRISEAFCVPSLSSHYWKPYNYNLLETPHETQPAAAAKIKLHDLSTSTAASTVETHPAAKAWATSHGCSRGVDVWTGMAFYSPACHYSSGALVHHLQALKVLTGRLSMLVVILGTVSLCNTRQEYI